MADRVPADDAAYPATAAVRSSTIAALDRAVIECRVCPRLVAWREEAGRSKRAAYRDQEYWSRPVPAIGPADARLLIVGLAPAAHGGNRTGRMFTGDRSGDFLFAALYAVGLASQPDSVSRDDGLRLFGTRITAPVHCAPPDNKPSVGERDNCRPWLRREIQLLSEVRAVVALGAFGWQQTLAAFRATGFVVPRPATSFGHGARCGLVRDDGSPSPRRVEVFGSYHVSQQNTFTGRLTPAMLERVLGQAADSAGLAHTEIT
jgi:uracil-DNA glycosylase